MTVVNQCFDDDSIYEFAWSMGSGQQRKVAQADCSFWPRTADPIGPQSLALRWERPCTARSSFVCGERRRPGFRSSRNHRHRDSIREQKEIKLGGNEERINHTKLLRYVIT